MMHHILNLLYVNKSMPPTKIVPSPQTKTGLQQLRPNPLLATVTTSLLPASDQTSRHELGGTIFLFVRLVPNSVYKITIKSNQINSKYSDLYLNLNNHDLLFLDGNHPNKVKGKAMGSDQPQEDRLID